MSTNVTAVMLTLNEAENIITALDSAEATFDELVLVDGESTDGTVYSAAEWCEDHDKDFQVLESSEREYLLEGPGMQRRRGADMASNDYVMALGADVEVEVHDESWFEQEFDHWGYVHTRTRPSGLVENDWRLYHRDPPFADDNTCRWRGIVHEELRTPVGHHISDVYLTAEAPMIHHQTREAAIDVRALEEQYPAAFGRGGHFLKKQHFLLEQAYHSERQKRYLHPDWRKYYDANRGLILQHAHDIAEQYSIPLDTPLDPGDIEDTTPAAWWDEMETGDPIMGFTKDTFTDYLRKQIPL